MKSIASHPESAVSTTRSTFALRILGFALLYFVGGQLGFVIKTAFVGITPLWPPSGIALFAMLVYGIAMWPSVVLGIVLLAWFNAIPPSAALFGIAAQVTEAWLAWYLLHRFVGTLNLERYQDLLRFILLAPTLPPAVSASVGCTGLVLVGMAPTDNWLSMWVMWWLGDAAGIIVLTPALLALHALVARTFTPARLGELSLLLLLSSLVAWLAFGSELVESPARTLLIYLVTPTLLWASIRFGLFGASLITVLHCGWLLWGSYHGMGVFGQHDGITAAMLIIAFLVATSFTALIVAALFCERNQAESKLRRAQEELEQRVHERTLTLEATNQTLKTQIEERRQTEGQLEIYKRLAATATQGMGFTSLEGKIVYANQTLAHMVGRDDPQKMLDEPVCAFYPEGRAELIFNEIIPQVKERGAWFGESELLRADGGTLPVLENVFMVRDEYGDPLYFADVLTDISERKEYEKQLVTAKEQAESANREKGDFLANMSHEIRTPMNGLLGFTDLLFKTPLNEEQTDYVETIKTSASDLLAIINDILDFSRIEAGKLTIKVQSLEVRACVSQAVSLFRPNAEAKGLELNLEIDPAVPTAILGDPLRIRQILANLISNAIKFTEAGSVRVVVTPEPTPGSGVRLHFAVIDTGIGLGQIGRGQLFQAFYQMDQGYRSHCSGSGLGLAISKQLVEQLGGEIGAENGPEQGAIFWFRLPAQIPATSPAEPEAAAPSPRPDYAQCQVLVVDDNGINRKVITTLLRKRRVRVDEATDGIEAVRSARVKQYDLILMDVRMPRMDGLEAAAQIRAAESPGRHTPIVGLTAHALPDELEGFRRAGFDECLTKPVMEGQLWQLMDQWAGEHPSRTQA